LTDGCTNFGKFLVEGTRPNLKKIKEYLDRSLMLVTALAPVIGYDKVSKIAHHAMDNDLTLKDAALKLSLRRCTRSTFSSSKRRIGHLLGLIPGLSAHCHRFDLTAMREQFQ
jgi:fumarate hydratase class II